MKNLICTLFLLFSMLIFSQQKMDTKKPLVLGVFSVSLKVKDLAKSKEFYEKLGFSSMGGDVKQNYLIMKNGSTLIGLFQGFIDENVLTFNPGWDENAKEVNPFTDVRDIQKSLKKDQIKLDRDASETTTGPEYIMLQDPDGNKILIDQHR